MPRAITEEKEAERREKISKASKHRWESEKFRQKVIEGLRKPRPKRKGIPPWNKGIPFGEEARHKMSESAKKRGKIPEAFTPEARAKRSKALFGKTARRWQENKEYRAKLLKHLEELNHSPHQYKNCKRGGLIAQQKKSELIKSCLARGRETIRTTPEIRQKISKASILQWQGRKSEMIKTLRSGLKRPNKKEALLLSILNDYFPDMWIYTGNGGNVPDEITKMGVIPDYMTTNSYKAVIELFGNYWHSPRRVNNWKSTELGRIMAYKFLGFDCLVVWESELKDKQAVVGKIQRFVRCQKN